MTRRPLISTPFPYTTLFRSGRRRETECDDGENRHRHHQLEQREATRRAACARHPSLTAPPHPCRPAPRGDRKSTRLNSSHVEISYAVFCLKKKRLANRSDMR